jgi:hypothetical protein
VPPSPSLAISQEIPPFLGWPLTAFGDATVFLHGKALPTELGPSTDTEYKELAAHLTAPGAASGEITAQGQLGATAGSVSPPFEAAGQIRLAGPRLSSAGEVTVHRQNGDTRKHTARGLVCFSERQRSISATLRSITCVGERDDNLAAKDGPALRPGWLLADPKNDKFLKWNFRPPAGRSADSEPCWFTLEEQCEALFQDVFGGPEEVAKVPAQGLVVLTGATNSAKTKIAQGLIFKYLTDRKKAGGPRPPHLVTFEDPIETFLVGPRGPDKLPGDVAKGDKARAYTRCTEKDPEPQCQNALHSWLDSLPKWLLAKWEGIDYTPREKGLDVRNLSHAFADALRQTPSVFYVGEVRDIKDWVEVLEFAGTGHLVVTTAHAGSLLEAMIKILSAVGADTPADRRRYAARIKAVVHLRPWVAEKKLTFDLNNHPVAAADRGTPVLLDYARLLLPAVWRQTEPGLASLSANGFGAVVPECPRPGKADQTSCLGRKWFARRLRGLIGDAGYLRAIDPLGTEDATTILAAAWERTDPCRKGQPWRLDSDEVTGIVRAMDQRAAKADLNRE